MFREKGSEKGWPMSSKLELDAKFVAKSFALSSEYEINSSSL